MEKMINEVQHSLPLPINVINWDGTIFQMIGPRWAVTTLSAWRVSLNDRMVFGCFDKKSFELVSAYKNFEVVSIGCQTSFLQIDPVLVLSNGCRIEVFSTDTFEPWTLQIDGNMFVPTPTSPETFMS